LAGLNSLEIECIHLGGCENGIMPDHQLANWLNAAKEAARRGAACLEQWRGRFTAREKGRFDLVSEADHAAQDAIREYLSRRFPDHLFIGEEGDASKNRPAPGSPPAWIVDPLDGTTNYVHDCPLYCVSIGLYVDGEAVVGVIFDPRSGEMFSAAKGCGAFLGDQRIRVSSVNRLGDALLGTGFAPQPDATRRATEWWLRFADQSQSLRRTGSTALNLAWIACGRMDGYWAWDNHPWDIAAGFVLIREAGGKVTRVDGSPEDCFAPDQVASNGHIHDSMLAVLREPR
jgi:myo-inositol-1(or 4)-monophosphatase